MSGLRGLVLTVRFLCELAMLAAVVWGALVAPKARWPVPIPTRVAIELILFGAAVGALAVAGQPLAAVALGVAALTTSLLNASQERQASDRPPSP